MSEKYRERVVAFVDILGFSRMVESVDPLDDADRILDSLEAALDEGVMGTWEYRQEQDEGQFTIRMFSDCIVVSGDPTYDGCLTVIGRLANVQKAMIRRGLLLRGAVTTGRHYESSRLLFSEGLVRAYRLEVDAARYPRIIVDAPVVPRFFQNKDPILANQLLLRDSDGQVFIHYLTIWLPESSYREEQFRRDLQKQRDLIEDGWRRSPANASIMRKLAWLQRYHNYKVNTLGPRFRDLFIGEPQAQGFTQVMADDRPAPDGGVRSVDRGQRGAGRVD